MHFDDKRNYMPAKISSDIILVLAVAIVFFSLASFITLFVVIYQRRQMKFKKSTEQLKLIFQQELLKTRLEIQEETFRNISQEIHDNIGQALSFVKLNLNTVDAYNAENVKKKLSESKELLTKSIHDLRDIARSLNPDFLNEIGLANAIEQQLQLLDKTQQYKTSFSVSGEVYKNDLHKELVVFRIVQELLNNIVKHAEANTVAAEMCYLQEKLKITIRDNGKGFDTHAMQSSKNNNGIGLKNMLNRMTLIDGYINIESIIGQGTTAAIELPKTLSVKKE